MIDRVKGILAKYTKADMNNIDEKTNLITDLKLSSLDVVNIIVDFEDEFDVEIPDRLVKNMKTIGDIVDYLESV